MAKTTTLIMCISMFVIAVDLITPHAMAQEYCIVPTVIENVEYPDGWLSVLEWDPVTHKKL